MMMMMIRHVLCTVFFCMFFIDPKFNFLAALVLSPFTVIMASSLAQTHEQGLAIGLS